MNRFLAAWGLAVLANFSFCDNARRGDWRQFRGNESTGAAADSEPILRKWNTANAIAWKVELPGRGPSSPIVVGNQVIVTCSGGREQQRLYVIAFDVASGRENWRRNFWATGRTLTHPTSAVAAPTPASDGQRIFAFYSSNDLVCLDLEGNLGWYRALANDYPKAGIDVGMSSSPLIVGNTVVVQVECQGNSFAAGIDAATGLNRWRILRAAVDNWSSPIAWRQAGKEPVVILQSPSGIAAHDAGTGDQLWRYPTECDSITSPTPATKVILVPSHGLSAILVPTDNTSPELLWESNPLGPGASSPVVDGERIYTVNRVGVLTCASLGDGQVLWKTRLGLGRQWATPAIADGHMVCLDSDGKAAVVRLGDDPQVVSKFDFGEVLQASPAVADGAVYLRSDRHLWKIAH